MPATAPSVLTFSAVGLTWPDGTRRVRRARPAGQPRAGRPGRRQRLRQVHAAPARGRRAEADPGLGVGGRRGGLPAAGPRPRPVTPRRRRARDRYGAPGAARARRRLRRPARPRGGRRPVGRRGARGRRAGTARPARLGPGPAPRRAVRRRGRPARAGPAAAPPARRPAPRRADQQPRRRGADAAATTCSGPGRAPCWWSATTASCSSGWTGSASCATVRCGGTAAASRRTPSRCGRAGGRRAGGDRRQVRRPPPAGRPGRGRAGGRPAKAAGRAQRRPHQHGQGGPGLLQEPVGEVGRVLPQGPRASGSTPPATGSRRPRPGCARTARSASTCRDTEVPRGRVVLTTDALVIRTGAPVELDLRGPDRVAVVGPNGAGKTTLLDTIVGELPPLAGSVRTHVPTALLPQRLDVLDPELSVVDNVVARAPGARPEPDPRPAGPLPVPRRGRRPAGRHAVRRRAVPRHPGGAAAGRPGTPAAAARRADEQPRPGVVRRPRVGADGVPRCAAGGQPRRAFLEDDRGGPDAGAQSSAMIEKMLPAGSVNQAIERTPAAEHALLVGLDRGSLVALEDHAPGGELVDGGLDVGNREVEHRVGRGHVVGLRVDDRGRATAELQPQDVVLLGHLDAEHSE